MNKKNDTGTFDRRSFLKTLSLAGASGLVLPKAVLHASDKANSRVVIVEDSAATGTGWSIDSSVVEAMVESGIKSLAQNIDVGEAWKSLLPGVSSSSIIALKVNCLFTLCTHPIVTYAVADSLTQMIFGGTNFPENNIIIFDRSDSNLRDNGGYTINKTTTGVRCMGTGYTGNYDVAGVSQQLSTILLNQADYLINIAVLKQHGMSGVSLCMKNHYGTCNDPNGLHGSSCNPYIAALNALDPIKNKQKVNIIDGLFGLLSGPDGFPNIVTNKIIMSTDIVAADYCGRELLKDHGCTGTGNSYHIETAAETYALGTNDPAKMDIVNITNPSTGVKKDHANSIPLKTDLEQNYPNPFNPTTNIKYTMSKAGNASLKIYDISGKEIETLVNGYHSAGTYNVQFHGHYLSSGTYIYRLQTIDHILTQKMILMK